MIEYDYHTLHSLEHSLPILIITHFQLSEFLCELHLNRLDPHMHDSYTNYIFRAMENSDSYYILGDIADVWGTARFKRHYLNEDNENSVDVYKRQTLSR